MDVGSLVVPVVAAVGGGGVAGIGGWIRSRRGVQSAARLIHAELTDNTAPIRYYRRVGSWPGAAEVRHAAWDQHGVTLSRMRRASAFHAIQQGYSALEGIAFVSRATTSGDGLSQEVAREILDLSIRQVRDALEKAGSLGGIAPDDVKLQVQAMAVQAAAPADAMGVVAPNAGAIPPSMLDAIVRTGSAAQSASATTTLEEMQARVSTKVEAAVGAPHRVIRNAQGSQVADGPVVRAEGDPPTGDAAVDELYDGLGAFHRFFLEVYGRDSVDGRGAPLEGVVHFGQNFSNLFWDGQRVVAGDGDGEIFGRFTAGLEMIAHEASLGVVQAETRLVFSHQAGALTSSIANAFGVLVKQYKLEQKAEEADWLMGSGVLGPAVKGVALQSMAAPGTAYNDSVLGRDPQPAHMRNYVKTEADLGGVHINPGIPNHAFYTAAVTLGGYAWERAGRIWYEALRDPRLRPNSGFRTFAGATRAAAERLYGEGSDEVRAVDAGWRKVGVSYPARR